MHRVVLMMTILLAGSANAQSSRPGNQAKGAGAPCALVHLADFVTETPDREAREAALDMEFKQLAQRVAAGELSEENSAKLQGERMAGMLLEMYRDRCNTLSAWALRNKIPLILDGQLPEIGIKGELDASLLNVFVLYRSVRLDLTSAARSDELIRLKEISARIAVVDLERVIAAALKAGQTVEAAFSSAIERIGDLAQREGIDLVLRGSTLPGVGASALQLRFRLSGRTVLYCAPAADLTDRVEAALLDQKAPKGKLSAGRMAVVVDINSILDRYSAVKAFEDGINDRIDRLSKEGGDHDGSEMASIQDELTANTLSFYNEVCRAIAEVAVKRGWDLVLKRIAEPIEATDPVSLKLKIAVANVVFVDPSLDQTDTVLEFLEAERKR